jgi:hypothetical protein
MIPIMEAGCTLREEIEKRVLRVLINTGLIILIGLALSFLNISLPSVLTIIPAGSFSLTVFISLIIIIVLFFTALRITLDLIRLMDAVSASFLRRIPGFNPEKSPSIIRALKELLAVFAVAICTSLSSPLISSIPKVGGWLSLALSIAAFAFSAILMYDAGKTIYAAFESSIQILVDHIVAHINGDEAKNMKNDVSKSNRGRD